MAVSVKKTPIDKSNEPVLGFGISQGAANEADLQTDTGTEAGRRVIDDLARVQERNRRRTAEAAQADLREAESAAAALRRINLQNNDTATPTLDSTPAQTESDLSAIEHLYGLSNLEYRQWLNNLQQLTDGLDQYGPLDPDAVVLKSATNVLAVSSNAVTYQKGTLTPQDALIGAILTYNNPASATGTVTIEGSLRARVLMTIASDMIGLTIKNPAIDMDAVRRNDPSVLKGLPPELAQELGQILQQFNALKNLNPNRTVQPAAAKPAPANSAPVSNITPIRPTAVAPAIASAIAPVATETLADQALANQTLADEQPELSLVDRDDEPAISAAEAPTTEETTAANVKKAIKPSAAPSVAPEMIPVLTDAVEPQAVEAAPTALQTLLSKGDANVESGVESGIAADNDVRAAFRIEAAAAPVVSEKAEEAPALEGRPAITKFPLYKWTPNGPKVLCP